jgi:hypothetical protein
MKARITCSLVATLLLTAVACARQEEPEYMEYDDEEMMFPDLGGTSSTGTGGKAGSLNVSGSSSTGKGGGTTLPPAGSVGGKGGTKSTGGTGGTASGGSSGSGGSGGSGVEEPVNMPVAGLSVTFKAAEGQGDVDFVGGELFVTNASTETFSLANIKIRYYFTNELNSPPAFMWNWGQFGPASNLGGITCTGMTVEMPSPKPGANFYIEVSCPDGSFASGTELRTSWKAGNQGAGKLTQNDDWSYLPTEGEATKIVVLDGNTIIGGVAP